MLGVDFSDELTPSLSFKYGSSGGTTATDRRRSLAIRAWCLSKCACASAKAAKASAVQGTVLQVHDNVADILVIQTTSSVVTTKTYRLVGAETNACRTPEGYAQACLPLYPESLLPGPSPAMQTVSPEQDAVAQIGPEQCGLSCSGFSDCAGNGKPGDCRCVVDPTPFEARQVGADPVGTFAICLTVSSLVNHVKGSSFQGYLGGRSLERAKDGDQSMDEINGRIWWQQPDLPCACNKSYVSLGCCNSTTGVVWEHHSLRMGRLT